MDEQFRAVAEIYDRMEKEIYALREENSSLKNKINGMAEELIKRSSEILRVPAPTANCAKEPDQILRCKSLNTPNQ